MSGSSKATRDSLASHAQANSQVSPAPAKESANQEIAWPTTYISFGQALRPRPIDNIVDDPVLLRLRRRHNKVPLHIALNPVQRLPR